jgi:hypothetical protein
MTQLFIGTRIPKHVEVGTKYDIYFTTCWNERKRTVRLTKLTDAQQAKDSKLVYNTSLSAIMPQASQAKPHLPLIPASRPHSGL